MPFLPARPGRPRALRVAAVGLLGLAVGVGATLAVDQLRGGGPAASVRRLDLPAAAAEPAPGAAAGQAPGRAVAAARPVAAGTARAAVERFLKATARGDFDGAYRLLDGPSRRRYPSAARWTRAQADRPEVTAVRVGAGRAREALPHARAAVRLGTRDALLWYHLAAAEADLHMTAPARRHLAKALAINPYLTVRDRPAALALAGRLHVPVPTQAGGR